MLHRHIEHTACSHPYSILQLQLNTAQHRGWICRPPGPLRALLLNLSVPLYALCKRWINVRTLAVSLAPVPIFPVSVLWLKIPLKRQNLHPPRTEHRHAVGLWRWLVLMNSLNKA